MSRQSFGKRLGARDISRLLCDDLESLLPELLPGGKRIGDLWHAGSLAGEAGHSLCVYLAGARRGKWKEFNGVDQYGDTLDLVVQTRGGGDFRRGLDWARRRLGLDELTAEQQHRRKQQAKRSEIKARVAERQDNHRRAVAIWREVARPLSPGDPVDRYLQGRGVSLAGLGRAPAALRYAPSLSAAPGQRFPAMVAAVTDVRDELIGIHRTFLECHSDGRVTKAPLGKDSKRCLGPCAGGSVKLWCGVSGKSWRDMPEHESVMLAEGIEDLLSALVIADIAFAVPARNGGVRQRVVPARELRGAAAVSLSLMQIVELPPQIERVVILAQRDPPGSPAQGDLQRVVERFRRERRQVLLLPPPSWSGVKDLNDIARILAG